MIHIWQNNLQSFLSTFPYISEDQSHGEMSQQEVVNYRFSENVFPLHPNRKVITLQSNCYLCCESPFEFALYSLSISCARNCTPIFTLQISTGSSPNLRFSSWLLRGLPLSVARVVWGFKLYFSSFISYDWVLRSAMWSCYFFPYFCRK